MDLACFDAQYASRKCRAAPAAPACWGASCGPTTRTAASAPPGRRSPADQQTYTYHRHNTGDTLLEPLQMALSVHARLSCQIIMLAAASRYLNASSLTCCAIMPRRKSGTLRAPLAFRRMRNCTQAITPLETCRRATQSVRKARHCHVAVLAAWSCCRLLLGSHLV